MAAIHIAKVRNARCFDCGESRPSTDTYHVRSMGSRRHRVCKPCYDGHGWREREVAIDFNVACVRYGRAPEALPVVTLTSGEVYA